MSERVTQSSSSPTVYRVRAGSIGGGQAEVTAGSETIAFDASWGRQPSGLPGPAELLASAFAACLLKNLERSGQLLPFRYDRAEVDVQARRQDAPPKFVAITWELRLVSDEPQHRVDLLDRNLRRFGTVYNTLSAACAIEGRILTTPTAATS
ncbi:OsmC family protein [Mycobacterium servetii]|uniref:OsmC family protein n=1 Tax=Mycobacterium servetii TaxID=3237418 RepID=A0ABV4BWV4_9MYCO